MTFSCGAGRSACSLQVVKNQYNALILLAVTETKVNCQRDHFPTYHILLMFDAKESAWKVSAEVAPDVPSRLQMQQN